MLQSTWKHNEIWKTFYSIQLWERKEKFEQVCRFVHSFTAQTDSLHRFYIARSNSINKTSYKLFVFSVKSPCCRLSLRKSSDSSSIVLSLFYWWEQSTKWKRKTEENCSTIFGFFYVHSSFELTVNMWNACLRDDFRRNFIAFFVHPLLSSTADSPLTLLLIEK